MQDERLNLGEEGGVGQLGEQLAGQFGFGVGRLDALLRLGAHRQELSLAHRARIVLVNRFHQRVELERTKTISIKTMKEEAEAQANEEEQEQDKDQNEGYHAQIK